PRCEPARPSLRPVPLIAWEFRPLHRQALGGRRAAPRPLKGPALRTAGGFAISNPRRPEWRRRRGGRAVEGARLESVYGGNSIAGSNPAPSAIPLFPVVSRLPRSAPHTPRSPLSFLGPGGPLPDRVVDGTPTL